MFWKSSKPLIVGKSKQTGNNKFNMNTSPYGNNTKGHYACMITTVHSAFHSHFWNISKFAT